MTSDDIKTLLKQESDAILNIPITDEFDKAIQLIVQQIHLKKGKLVTSGMGKAGQIAMNIATTFSSTGTPSVFLHPSEAQHATLDYCNKTIYCYCFPIPEKQEKLLSWCN
jgi:arabinose-5-phosphate isomerase